MATSVTIKLAKKELRKVIKHRLSSIPFAIVETQSIAAFQAVTSLKAYQDARNISVYLSMPSGEIQTDAIVRHALSAGKVVFVPFLHANMARVKGEGEEETPPKKVMDMVGLKDLGDYEDLERDSWGIPTVGIGATGRKRVLGEGGRDIVDKEGLDLILLPGVVFETQKDGTEQGKVRRLGHGRGFYDFFLYCYRKVHYQATSDTRKRVLLYGLCLEEQFIHDGEGHEVPMGPHDQLLDGLIVGDGHVVDSLATKR